MMMKEKKIMKSKEKINKRVGIIRSLNAELDSAKTIKDLKILIRKLLR